MNMREEIVQKLQEKRDQKYRDFHGGLCPGLENIIGVRVPELRKIAKEITRGDWRSFLGEVQNEYYEETVIEGLVIATVKMELAERLDWLRKFVPKIDNWATCDIVCASFKFKPGALPEVWNFVEEYHESEQEFEQRFRLIIMLDYFLIAGYIDAVLNSVGEIRSEKYYIKMAQAWLIAEAFTKFREPALAFLKQNQLLGWVQNKAIQKIRESYRVSKEDKELVKSLKR